MLAIVSNTPIASPCRQATIADFSELVSFVRSFCAHFDYRFSESGTPAALRTLLGDPSLGEVFLVEHNGSAVGYAVLVYSFSLEFGGRTAFIDEFFIDATGRGHGLGGHVLEFLASHCRGLGINAILLEAEETNPRATALYEKAGFQFFHRRLLTKILNPNAGYKASRRSE